MSFSKWPLPLFAFLVATQVQAQVSRNASVLSDAVFAVGAVSREYDEGCRFKARQYQRELDEQAVDLGLDPLVLSTDHSTTSRYNHSGGGGGNPHWYCYIEFRSGHPDVGFQNWEQSAQGFRREEIDQACEDLKDRLLSERPLTVFYRADKGKTLLHGWKCVIRGLEIVDSRTNGSK